MPQKNPFKVTYDGDDKEVTECRIETKKLTVVVSPDGEVSVRRADVGSDHDRYFQMDLYSAADRPSVTVVSVHSRFSHSMVEVAKGIIQQTYFVR